MDRLPQTHKIQNPNSLKSANSSPQLLRTEVRPETRVNFPEALPGLADVQAPIEARRVREGFSLLSLPAELQDSILRHVLSFVDMKDFIQMGNLLHAIDEEIQATKTSKLTQELKTDKCNCLVNFAKVCLSRFKFDAIDLTAGFNKITIFQLIHKKASRVLAEASDYNPEKPFKFQTIRSLTVFTDRAELASQLFDSETTTIHISKINRAKLLSGVQYSDQQRQAYNQEHQGYNWPAQLGLDTVLDMLIPIEENWVRSVTPTQKQLLAASLPTQKQLLEDILMRLP